MKFEYVVEGVNNTDRGISVQLRKPNTDFRAEGYFRTCLTNVLSSEGRPDLVRNVDISPVKGSNFIFVEANPVSSVFRKELIEILQGPYADFLRVADN